MKKKTKVLLAVLFIVLVLGLYYWIHPALNIQSFGVISLLVVILFALSAVFNANDRVHQVPTSFKQMPLTFKAAVAVLLAVFVVNTIFSSIFMSRRYASLIDKQTGSFADDVAEVDLNNVAALDRESTQKLGDRTMGQIPELVSQFSVSDQYTQIIYKGRLVRVTPIDYAGFFQYMNNRSTGTPGYILVDSTTGQSSLVQTDRGLKYTENGILGDNIYRHVQLQYPTYMLYDAHFEIDEDGAPYWITPVKKVVAVDEMTDVQGAIITDAVTGESHYYKTADVPEWVDYIYPASLIESQLNDNGKYQSGWWNSMIGQKGVTKTTNGYNYVACNANNDVCLYTGITSAAADESNLGFVLVNMRTKETRYYAAPGAEEYSVMDTAKGIVQEKGNSATFPILVNVNGKPTYMLSLKDDAGLVKMYSFVDAQDYQKVTATDAANGLQAALNDYLKAYSGSSASSTAETITGMVTDVKTAVINGNTYYYFVIKDQTYVAVATASDRSLPFVSAGDTISFTADGNGNITSLNP